MKTTFCVQGAPVPKERPRVTRRVVYRPQRTADYEARIRDAWRASGGAVFAADTPLRVTVFAHFEIPKSLSRRARAALEGQPHTKHRGDIDNIAKAVLDALNGCAFADDCCVCELVAQKDYATTPSTEITIEDWSEFT
jgi:Holliday junction resolvase RusA-like endonuclease